MRKYLEIFMLGSSLLSLNIYGKVRNIRVNDQRMAHIKLKIGQSTLLSFSDPPQKVIMGNPDLIEAEFTGNDLALRPRGLVFSNLFVYTKERTYAFVIQVINEGDYDDLVHVKWRPRYSYTLYNKRPSPERKKRVDVSFRVTIHKTQWVKQKGIFLIDFFITNISKGELDLELFEMELFQGEKILHGTTFVLSRKSLKKGESAKGKAIASLKKREKITLLVKSIWGRFKIDIKKIN